MIDTGLTDKVVIVTGAAAGIGRATALAFAAQGAKVSAWDVAPFADDFASDLESAGGGVAGSDVSGDRADVRSVDVTDAEAVEAAVEAVVARWGGVDVLVNNAGILRDAQLVKWKGDEVASTMTDAAFDAVVAVNLKGPFLCARAVVPHMIRRGGGVLLAASSVVAHDGNFGQTNYAATKAGVINMAQTWSRELGRYGIRANAVAPGFIATEMVQAMPPKVLEGMVAHTPIGRMGKPEDIANAYVWLASDAASFVNGVVLSVDGGLVIGT